MSIASNLALLEDRIEKACRAAGRLRSEVRLVAVSKRHPASAIDEALGLGLTEFGENYVQEALDKFPRPGANLHFIGNLQRNKVRKILAVSSLVHGVGSLPVLEAIDRIAGEEGLRADFLLQIHLTGEATKSGFSREELPAALDACAVLAHSRLRGFMAMAPLDGSREAAVPVFREARRLFETARDRFPGFDTLSMGMSGDLEEAVAAGSTHLRVGTALFGERVVS